MDRCLPIPTFKSVSGIPPSPSNPPLPIKKPINITNNFGAYSFGFENKFDIIIFKKLKLDSDNLTIFPLAEFPC